ncbi:MAG: nitroreductase family protein [Firmicutes bacterium]|nr:nitroreductase family protein [Bacillota bacterium]MCM1401024.1 nitroreductase family protein [Bacteroides sp.]MCM1476943.1 nitroreductase family protein [Bacteroides sp.]
MKTSYFICIILVAALAIVSWQLVKANQAKSCEESTETTDNAAYDCIMSRASCRSFTGERLSEGQIDSLLRAGMAAPTARNQQPWQLVVITDRDILDTIAANQKNIKMAAEAPMAIVACGDMGICGDKDDFWQQDLSAVTENILLAANSMGLGAVWCGIYPNEERVKFVRELLELPDSIIPLNVIPIGYPATKLSPKEKFNQERVHYNGW